VNQLELPRWLPNWDDDTAYPETFDEWPLDQWVWAFLRRNSEYQSDYARFAALPGFWPGGGKTPKWSGRSMGDDDDMAFRYCDPPALQGETSKSYWQRNHGKVITETALEGHLMEKWGVVHLPDPADENGFKILGLLFEMPPYILDISGPDISGWVPPPPDPDEMHHVTLRFDLRFEDLDGQLRRASEILRERRDRLQDSEFGDPEFKPARASTVQVRKLPAYLRAFDASLADIGPRELALKLRHPSKRAGTTGEDAGRAADEEARRAIAAGVRLVNDRGYLDLMKFR
jgi:hypothetical protein